MPFAIEYSGPREPLAATPPRLNGSVRRTTTIDVSRDDLYGPGRIDARGRDLATDTRGEQTVLRTAHLVGAVDAQKVLTSLVALDGDGPPSADALAALTGVATTAGFRRTLAAALADDTQDGTLWHLLLDDLVGAVLVSGVAPQHAEERGGGGPIEVATRDHAELMFASMSDICAGWATDAVMLSEFRRTGKLPVACGPSAPTLESSDDPWSWHATDRLPPHGVRRCRRLDVGPTDREGVAPLDVHFRDSHVDQDGVERCVHEYRVTGALDVQAGVLRDVDARALVLPWQECPGALGSERRLAGVPLAELRGVVRRDLRGTPTCTHLNDTLRSLADLGALLRAGVPTGRRPDRAPTVPAAAPASSRSQPTR